MSFLSGGQDTFANQAPKPLGIERNKLSTNEQARPVPYFAGQRRVAVTFMSKTFDIKKAEVTRDVGKQKTKIGTSYFFSFAALIAHGPLDGITAIILNNETVWTGDLVRDVSNPDFVDITIEDYGLIRVYWGTETQKRDDYLYNRAGGYDGISPQHPPYKGFAYLVAHQLFAGFNQSNIQNLEVIVSRYPVLATDAVTSPAVVGVGANPINVLYELLTNPRLGRGLQIEELNKAAIVAVGYQLWTEGIGLSPLIDRQEQAIAIVQDLLEYFDGYPVITDGVLSFALTRPVLDQSGLPVVDESVMVDPLNITPEDWSKTFNELNVKFTNPVQNYDADVRTWRDRGNFAITGDLNVQTTERPWVTSPAVAEFMATALGRTRALPDARGALKLRMTSLFASLIPGALFKLNYPPRGYTNLVCRVIERTVSDPSRPLYEIGFKIDRTYLLNGLAVGSDTIPDGPLITAASLVFVRAVELPVALSPDGLPTITVLASRPDVITSGFKTHLGQNYDTTGIVTPASFDVIDTHDRFAIHGTLSAEFAASEPLIGGVGLQVELDGPDTELDDVTMFDGLADELLVFIGSEIFSVTNATLTGINNYSLSVIRARYGTVPATHAFAAQVFIVRRDEMNLLQHPLFVPGNIACMKTQAFTGQAQTALEDETSFDVALAGFAYAGPPLANLSVNGLSLSVTYTTGQSVVIAWTLTDGGELPHRFDLLKRSVVLKFFNAAGDTLLGTTSTPGNSLTLTNAQLQALLGGSEVSFLLEAFLSTESDFWTVESEPITLPVTLV